MMNYTNDEKRIQSIKEKLSASGNSDKLKVQYFDDQKGVGLVATKDIKVGEVVLEDFPLIHIQKYESKLDALVCSHCMKFVGSLEEQVQMLGGLDKGISLPFKVECFDASSIVLGTVACPQNCGEVYCSEKCSQTAFDKYHKPLCTKNSPGHPMILFERYSMNTFDEFRLAARMAGMLMMEAERCGSLDNAWNLLDHLAWRPWSTIIPAPDSTSKEDWEVELQDKLKNAVRYLQSAVSMSSKYPSLFTEEVFNKLLGMIAVYNTQTIVNTPVPQYFSNIEKLSQGDYNEAMNVLKPIIGSIVTNDAHNALRLQKSEDDFELPYAEGVALCSTQGMINHSCVPNCQQHKGDDDKDNRIIIKAVTLIPAGTEITLAYMDVEGMNLAERKAFLKYPYGFECKCSTCISEEASSKDTV